jgi:hypothetical protein
MSRRSGARIRRWIAVAVVLAAGVAGMATSPDAAAEIEPTALCDVGTFSASGLQPCALAPAGTFVATQGATQATLCPQGTYQSTEGSASCFLASPGYYVDVEGAVAQLACPSGFSSNAGAIVCTRDLDVLVFSGFRSPVDAMPTFNTTKAGQTVPLKFRVTDSGGAPVTTLTEVSLTVLPVPCEVGASTDTIEVYAAGGSGLQNLGDGEYQFNWKTPKAFASSCKELTLDLGDGVGHSARFQFTR